MHPGRITYRKTCNPVTVQWSPFSLAALYPCIKLHACLEQDGFEITTYLVLARKHKQASSCTSTSLKNSIWGHVFGQILGHGSYHNDQEVSCVRHLSSNCLRPPFLPIRPIIYSESSPTQTVSAENSAATRRRVRCGKRSKHVLRTCVVVVMDETTTLAGTRMRRGRACGPLIVPSGRSALSHLPIL